MNANVKLAVSGGCAVAVTALVSACGGGGGGGDFNNTPTPPPPAVTSQVPASASTSLNGFIDYLKLLVVASADTLEPVDTSTVTPMTDETSEPQPID